MRSQVTSSRVTLNMVQSVVLKHSKLLKIALGDIPEANCNPESFEYKGLSNHYAEKTVKTN